MEGAKKKENEVEAAAEAETETEVDKYEASPFPRVPKIDSKHQSIKRQFKENKGKIIVRKATAGKIRNSNNSSN